MKNIKQLSLLALLVGLVVPNGTFARGNEDKDQKTVPQKIGATVAKTGDDAKKIVDDIGAGFKKQHKKDKEKQKAEKAQRKAQENK